MFVYCNNVPTRYCDNTGTIIEDFDIKPYYIDGELLGFSVAYDERFLIPEFCLEFAHEYVKEKGDGITYAKMSPARIALELYAHAELYVIGQGIEDPLSSDDYTIPDDSTSALIPYLKHTVKNYLISRAEIITVNNNENIFRMIGYSYLWKKKTGRSWYFVKPNLPCEAEK